MDKFMQITIHCKWSPDGRFFLYGMDKQWPLDPKEWVPHLLQWHETSFYGTIVEHSTYQYMWRSFPFTVDGIVLDAYGALELFAKRPFNEFVEWEWNEWTETLFSIAPVLFRAVQARKWIPDLGKWRNGTFQWQLPDAVLEEIGPEILHQPFVTIKDMIIQKRSRFLPLEASSGKRISGNRTFLEKLETGEPLLVRDVLPYWFHQSVDQYLERELGEKWRRLREKIAGGVVHGKSLADFFDEESFKRWAGFTEEKLPFTFVLQLEEPDEDGTMWQLNTFVRERDLPDELIPLEEVRAAPYRGELVAMQDGICRLFPWLERDDSVKAFVKIKEALVEEEAWEFLTVASEILLLLDIDILLPSWWEELKDAKVKLKAHVKSPEKRPSFVGLDAIMDFEWRLSIENMELTEEQFSQIVSEKRRLIRLGDQWVKLDPALIKKIKTLMDEAEKRGMRVQDLIQQQLLYGDEEPAGTITADEEDLLQQIQFELHPRLRSFVDTLTHLTKLPEYPVPKTLNGKLRPYQQKGMSWLYFLRQFRFGAILADDMGLGKTIQLISYLLLVREQDHESGPALIICPTSVLGNWQNELERFAPDLHVYVHYGPKRLKEDALMEQVHGKAATCKRPDVVLTTYTLAQLDFEDLNEIEWDVIVLDEAQHIKNPQTKQSLAIRKLKGKHHIALTGTPMENRLTELWSIFDFINKGYLGSLAQFQMRFAGPIEREKNEEKIRELRNIIKPFLLRRTKEDPDVALNLPEKLEQKAYCPLTTEQAALYQQIVEDAFLEIEELDGFQRRGYVLRVINHLKQLCNHPALYLKDFTDESRWLERSTKLEKLVDILDVVLEQEESALIFTQYIGMGKMMQKVLGKRYGIKVPFLRGSTMKHVRDEMVEDFQNRQFPIFILSLKAGGTGLNLTAANHVIHYDRWWNPAVENQATDRAYRIGQTKFVHVHKFITTGTLEEKIDAMLEQKQALNEEIIQGDRWITELSNDELYHMLRLD